MPFYSAPAKDEKDPGLYVRHPKMDPDEHVQLHRVLTGGMVRTATTVANASGTYDADAYRSELIKAMVLPDTQVRNAALPKDHAKPWYDLRDDDTLRDLPALFKIWLVQEINECDGSVTGVSKVKIGGKDVDFRRSTTVLG